MNGVIARVSKFGFQVEGDKLVGQDGKQKWYNLSKYEKGLTLDGLNKGDTVDYEANGKGFVTKLVKNASSVVTDTQVNTASQVESKPASYAPNDKDVRITRLSALSTAFGALSNLKSEGDSLDDLTGKAEVLSVRLTRYAMTGNFDENTEATNV